MSKSEKPNTAGRSRVTAKSGKKATNLTLESDAIHRGERFGKRHGTSLSQLVSKFLRALPADDASFDGTALSPAVRRLAGVAANKSASRESHRAHLRAKYGSKRK